MNRFHKIEEAAVILKGKKGIFRQANVYHRGEHVFAGYGGGFVRLISGGSTTNPDVSWIDLEADGVTAESGKTPVWAA